MATPEKRYPEDVRKGWSAAVVTTDWGGTVLLVSARRPDGVRVTLEPFQFKEAEMGATAAPALVETREERLDNLGDVTGFLQAVVNAAWDHGIRPDAMTDRAGELGATKAHLEDMRTLVFERLPVVMERREP